MDAAATLHERWAAHMFGQQVRFVGNDTDTFRRPGCWRARFEMTRQVDHRRMTRNRKALVMTLTDDSAMAAAAMAGESIQPKVG